MENNDEWIDKHYPQYKEYIKQLELKVYKQEIKIKQLEHKLAMCNYTR